MRPLVVVGILVVIGALVVAAMSLRGAGDDYSPLNDVGHEDFGFGCTCTVYIKNDAGVIYSAPVDLWDISFEENMMLSFGGSIRQTNFLPLTSHTSTMSSIQKTANDHSIWVQINIGTEAFNVKSYDKFKVVCSGYAGATQSSGNPDHATSSNPLCTAGKSMSITVEKNNISPSDDFYTQDQITLDQSSNGIFSNCLSSAGGSLVCNNKLLGDQIDGAVLHVSVYGAATFDSGGTMTGTTEAELKISVSSWSSSSLSVALTSISSSGR